MLQVVTNGTQAEYQGLESGGNKEEEDPQKVQTDSQERQGWTHVLVRPRNMQQEAPTELGTLVNFTGVSGVVGRSLLYHL